MKRPNLGVWVEKGLEERQGEEQDPGLGWMGPLLGLDQRKVESRFIQGGFDRAGDHGGGVKGQGQQQRHLRNRRLQDLRALHP